MGAAHFRAEKGYEAESSIGKVTPCAPLRLEYGCRHDHFLTFSCYRRLPLLGTARARDVFMQVLEETRQRFRFVALGFVVMPEQVHVLITEPKRGSPHGH